MHARACVYVYMYVCMYMGKRWREVTMDDVFFIYSNNIFTSVLIPLVREDYIKMGSSGYAPLPTKLYARNMLGMSDRSRLMQCCFTSTETVVLLGTGLDSDLRPLLKNLTWRPPVFSSSSPGIGVQGWRQHWGCGRSGFTLHFTEDRSWCILLTPLLAGQYCFLRKYHVLVTERLCSWKLVARYASISG